MCWQLNSKKNPRSLYFAQFTLLLLKSCQKIFVSYINKKDPRDHESKNTNIEIWVKLLLKGNKCHGRHTDQLKTYVILQ